GRRGLRNRSRVWQLLAVPGALDISEDGFIDLRGGAADGDGTFVKGAPGPIAVVTADAQNDAALQIHRNGSVSIPGRGQVATCRVTHPECVRIRAGSEDAEGVLDIHGWIVGIV